MKGLELSKSSLQAGSTSSGYITVVEEVALQNMMSLKHKILAILVPQDAEKMKLLRHEMSLDTKSNKLKGEFENLLMRSSTVGLM